MSTNKKINSRLSANPQSSEVKDNNMRYRIKTSYGTRHSNLRMMQRQLNKDYSAYATQQQVPSKPKEKGMVLSIDDNSASTLPCLVYYK